MVRHFTHLAVLGAALHLGCAEANAGLFSGLFGKSHGSHGSSGGSHGSSGGSHGSSGGSHGSSGGSHGSSGGSTGSHGSYGGHTTFYGSYGASVGSSYGGSYGSSYGGSYGGSHGTFNYGSYGSSHGSQGGSHGTYYHGSHGSHGSSHGSHGSSHGSHGSHGSHHGSHGGSHGSHHSSHGPLYGGHTGEHHAKYESFRAPQPVATKRQRATVVVRVPDESVEVYFEGRRIELDGTETEFVTPMLEEGRQYHYTIRVKNGDHDVTRQADVRAGADLVVQAVVEAEGLALTVKEKGLEGVASASLPTRP